ncbi:MAG: winged helix-turn-helix domain-containing protein [Phormidesmis sp.]
MGMLLGLCSASEYDFNPSTNVVDMCIQRLRKKIDIEGQERWIESVRGVGYRFRQAE